MVLLTVSLFAQQAPQSFSYQAVVRGTNNTLVTNKTVGMKISLLQGSNYSWLAYAETHVPTTNENGLVSIAIGGGTKVSGNFATIDWSKGPYFVKSEIDPTGGSNYSLTTVSQLLSVPYALYAANSQPGPKGDKGDIGVTGPQGPQGLQGVKGDKGDPGTFSSGTQIGEMKYWDGTIWNSITPGNNGQSLTFCDGIPIWTTGNLCPAKIKSFDCNYVKNTDTLIATKFATGIIYIIPYLGGNNGHYNSQNLNSKGVLGLIAALDEGNLNNGNGNLIFKISGTPDTNGIASFDVNIGGQSCNISIMVSPKPIHPTSGFGENISDIDGNIYKTVYIGAQQWMQENLNTSKFNDGTPILNLQKDSLWYLDTLGSWCSYYTQLNLGKLYNWYVLNPVSNGNKNICPSGWHVPSDNDWRDLINYLGGDNVAGAKMKEIGKWNTDKYSKPTNTSLFSAWPGGVRWYTGDLFGGMSENPTYPGDQGGWWSSTVYDRDNSYHLELFYNKDISQLSPIFKGNGYSIRCLKD
jgi:uncharacterized protein (TIGR02145 family)